MKYIKLNNGVEIPQIGFGTYKSTTNTEGWKVVAEAIDAGYRHLDTAMLYRNEGDVGRAVKESGIPRQDFFITSKLNRNCLGYQSAKDEFEKTCQRLDTDYLDLYLIHWPRADFGQPDFDDWKEEDRGSWKAMEELYKEGKVRAIGVSNFLPHHLENLLETAEVIPAVNQLELHPGYLQSEAVTYSRNHGMEIEAWSPIGRGRLLNDPLLLELAEKYGVSVPHLCLAFDLQMGYIIIPKSIHRSRMEENLHPDTIRISDEDMEKIKAMPTTGWSGEHPDRETLKPQ